MSDGASADALAGFDVVAQFSHNLLNLQVVRSLAQHGVSTLRAYVPWGTVTLPAALLASVPRHLRLMLGAIPARLEVELSQPSLAALRWPPVVEAGGGSSWPANTASVLQRRAVDIGWNLQVDLLVARFDVATQGIAPAPPGDHGGIVAPSAGATAGPTVPSDDGSWERVTLGVGYAVTSAEAHVDVPPGHWQFGMTLDLAETTASVESDDGGVIEFVNADAGNALVAQALAPLRAAVGIRLSPPIAPAGALAAGVVTRQALPAFSVEDRLLVDQRGGPVLSLCAQLAGRTGGVARLVQVQLAGQDFAYAASEAVLRSAYGVCWEAVAAGQSFVGDVPVDLPVDNDPNVTATGTARLLTSFADSPSDVAITVTAAGHSDAVRLLVYQRVQLLGLWDHDGNEITNLGDLANPVEEPTAIPITLFDSGGTPPSALNPNFRDVLMKLVGIQAFPTLEPFPARAQSVSGFCSAPTKTLLVRWTLRDWRDDVLAPTPGGLSG